MVIAEDKYIVGKDGQWMKSSRPDLLRISTGNLWSIYVNDAKRFNTRQEAKRKARMVGGVIWRFNPVTGKLKEATVTIPAGAKCDSCGRYALWDGTCRSPESEYYREPVSFEDVCDEWEGKANGREGQADSAAIPGERKVKGSDH